MTALAPWFGSKRTLAPKIVEQLGDHKAYWEPFCGSCAVLLAKPRCRLETINDLHADLINLARVVAHPSLSKELYQRARLVLCSDEELKTACAEIKNTEPPDEPSVTRALHYLAESWMARNGEAGLVKSEQASSLCVRWTNNGGAPGKRWHEAVRSIAFWHRRLSQVIVLKRDGFEVLEKIADESDAAIYIDPPYLIKSDAYQHDFEPGDHELLALLARRFRRARVVVSYYHDNRLADLYPNWTVVDCARVKHLGNLSPLKQKGSKTIAPEVLLLNGPAYGEGASFFGVAQGSG